MRNAVPALLISFALAATAAAQTTAPSATPTTGAVGSAAQRGGFPASGGAVALPVIGNSGAVASTGTPLPGTMASLTASTSTGSTNFLGATATGSTTSSGSGGGGGGGGFSGTGARGGAQTSGSANTAGAATATGPSGSGSTFVLCPPSGAPGLEPLFIGTDLSCAPH